MEGKMPTFVGLHKTERSAPCNPECREYGNMECNRLPPTQGDQWCIGPEIWSYGRQSFIAEMS